MNQVPVVDYPVYAEAVSMYKRRNNAMRRAMLNLETAMMAAQAGDTHVVLEKLRFAWDMLDAARRDGLEVFE